MGYDALSDEMRDNTQLKLRDFFWGVSGYAWPPQAARDRAAYGRVTARSSCTGLSDFSAANPAAAPSASRADRQ